MKVLDDGLVDMKYGYQLPESAQVTDQGVFLTFQPFKIIAGTKLLIDGESHAFSKADDPPGDKSIFKGTAGSLVFNPDKPGKSFSLVFPGKNYLEVRENRQEKDKDNMWKYCAEVRINPDKNGGLNLKLDIRNTSTESLKAEDTFAGINFWKDDRLHIPGYSKCKNLAQNPSFEAGLRYYYLYDTWAVFKVRNKPVFSVDDNVAHGGNRSLKINAWKGDNDAGLLNTFALPTIPDRQYTVSFYAKGDRPDGLSLVQDCVSGVWLKFPKVPAFAIGSEWKRYSYTVTAPNNAITFMMKAVYHGNDPSGAGCIWVDDLQIEEGDKAGDYIEKPLCAELLTSNPDNFLSADSFTPVNARLRITATPNSAGTVECKLEDYFYQGVWSNKFSFKTDDKGVATVVLPLEGVLGRGIYVLRADFGLDNGFKDSDYFRIARMNFLDNTHTNKKIFATSLPTQQSRGDDLLERCRQIGFGSANYWSAADKSRFERLARYGIDFSVNELGDHSPLFKKSSIKLQTIEVVTPEIEKEMEEIARAQTEAAPWVPAWDLSSELDSIKLLQNGNYTDFAKLQIAAFKGVKRADPKKKFYLGGSANMEPRAGIRCMDKYLETIGDRVHFDGITMHPYRTTPENPDLDSDAAVFLAVLEKHGYKDAPVFWEEGIYYPNYNIPAWGLSPYRGCSSDHYRAGCPSYHMGWGERISAAYFARSWLVALKYQDRVKQFNGWCGGFLYMDAYLTPFALQKIPNTLGRLLGNASFKKDIRFAPDMRSYVFEDEKGRPVAALWSYIEAVDKGLEAAPVAKFNFKGKRPEAIDLMENSHSISVDKDGSSQIAISPFPIFLRGQKGDMDSICAAIQNASLPNSNKPIVEVSANPQGTSGLAVSFRNLVTREVNGEAGIKLEGGLVNKAVHLEPLGVADMSLELPMKIPFNEIATINLPVSFTEKGLKPMNANLSFTAFAVRKLKEGMKIETGAAGVWDGIPSIPMTNRCIDETTGSTTSIPVNEKVGYPGDFTAAYQMAWDDENLYLKVNVTDDVFHHDANKKSVGGRYDNDSLQIYIDTLCNARQKATRGFDGDDYNYDFYPDMAPDSTAAATGKIIAYRRNAPEQQQAGGLFAPMPNMLEPDIKGVFKRTDKGYSYEVVMPKKLIAPLQLHNGNIAGFAIYLNDHDGKCVKGGLSTTSVPGTGGWRNPHLYPVMLLTE